MSFVASQPFFFDRARKFETVQLLFGIDSAQRAWRFAKDLDPAGYRHDLENLTDHEWHRLQRPCFKVKYAVQPDRFHNKLYLLDGSGRTRLMVGSANFTDAAFAGASFEDLLVFDDDLVLFPRFDRRFEEVWSRAADSPASARSRKLAGLSRGEALKLLRTHLATRHPEVLREVEHWLGILGTHLTIQAEDKEVMQVSGVGASRGTPRLLEIDSLCPRCHQATDRSANYCKWCGARLPPATAG